MARAMLETGKGAGLNTDKLIKHFRSTKGGIWLVNAPECSPWGYMYLRGQVGFTTSNSKPFRSALRTFPQRGLPTSGLTAQRSTLSASQVNSSGVTHRKDGQGIDQTRSETPPIDQGESETSAKGV